jgi:exopolysaccharide biosynthesis polyprenyl glycosylphosphotransferase
MTPQLGRIAPSPAGRWNLGADLAVVVGALSASMLMTGGHLGSFALQARILLALCVWLLGAAALHHYDPWADERGVSDDAMLTTVLCGAVVTSLFVLNRFSSGHTPLPRTLQTFSLLWPTAVALRLFVFRPIARKGGALDEVIVVGTGPLGRVTGEDLERSNRRRVLGYVSFSHEPRPTTPRIRFLGQSSELEGLLATLPVNEVYIAGSAIQCGAEMQQLIQICERQGVPFALPASHFRFERAQALTHKALRDGYVHYLPFHVKPSQMAFKRLFDIASSAVALWLLLPVIGLIALAIKLTSHGPVLFRQARVGLHGKHFHMLKFRSMVVDAEKLRVALEKQNEQSGPVFKMKNDPRITSVGRFIRKYSLDELPQLINVLRGDMSVVGPRPPIPSEVAKYEPWQRRRLSMRPGLTCIWQVSGRNQISFDQWMYLDMQYIDHWSFGLDLNLIFRTFPVVLTGRGAS